jgi:flagellar hook-length control protein FliK
MPVASNPLLQPAVASKPARAVASPSDKPLQGANDKASGFSDVYAQQSRQGTSATADASKRDKGAPATASAADGKDAVESGKALPEDQDSTLADASATPDPTLIDPNLVAGQVTDAQPGAQLIQAQAEAVAPVVQAAQLQAQVTLAPVVEPEPPFDPEADPLADMPALRMALEQSAQAQGTTSAHAVSKPTTAQPDAAATQPAVNTLAAMVDTPAADAGHGEPGEKAFAGLLDDGLKDLKSAASDTRVDDFADRLSNLTQAVTAKTAAAVPAPAPAPLHQPLAMNQGGWTEGLVNRVMYLSSQNLKSAEIQLEPAELGRLDIRVHLAPEQQAQITFTSGHVGVREALENQVHRLKDMFAQQGLGQPDVNVADQSRGQQQQGNPDAPRLSGVAARRNAAGEDVDVAATASPVEQQTVVGSSAVDYYA